jgi:hypothetical protein
VGTKVADGDGEATGKGEGVKEGGGVGVEVGGGIFTTGVEDAIAAARWLWVTGGSEVGLGVEGAWRRERANIRPKPARIAITTPTTRKRPRRGFLRSVGSGGRS